MRFTLADVAREAGVSPATADRVLNNRSGVRPRTREIVLETAQRLGYIAEADGRFAGVRETEVVRLDFILPEGTNTFIKMLHRQIETQARRQQGGRVVALPANRAATGQGSQKQ